MRIHLLCVGRRMPAWVDAGYAEYARRLSGECSLNLVEIEPGHRGKGTSPEPARREEGERLLKALPKGALAIALDERGDVWDTARLATELSGWLAGGREPALLVGGADGLTTECLERAERRWSLSALTFPHPLVRVILAEQLYRAWTLVKGHPYHRA
jgi:23S rRNA (pseudouridine1915-N3)-methyltransferase